YFFETILGMSSFDAELGGALEKYGKKVKTKLIQCRETQGMRVFLERLPTDSTKIVVSGGKQLELRDVFKERMLDKYFDSIFGSPDDKLTILKRETNRSKYRVPAVFIGDTQYDFECARNCNVDFIFMTQYTEFKNWSDFLNDKKDKVKIIKNLGEL
ncbi:MAG: HAD hydrolase-like protein, partial [Ignavibacteriae bacterium]|nr:HAD hydrolase-like protein [Ignavibacteriota bacterium]